MVGAGSGVALLSLMVTISIKTQVGPVLPYFYVEPYTATFFFRYIFLLSATINAIIGCARIETSILSKLM